MMQDYAQCSSASCLDMLPVGVRALRLTRSLLSACAQESMSLRTFPRMRPPWFMLASHAACDRRKVLLD